MQKLFATLFVVALLVVTVFVAGASAHPGNGNAYGGGSCNNPLTSTSRGNSGNHTGYYLNC
jgi:hypothetical protein